MTAQLRACVVLTSAFVVTGKHWLVLLVDHLGAAAGLLHLHPADLRCCALLASHHIHVPPLDAGHMAEDTPV